VTALHHDHPHRDVNKWARVARQANEARLPERPPERPRPAAARYTEPTYNDHRAWEMALARPCPRHGAEPGQPCWPHPVGMCATRTHTTGHAAVSRRAA
jgi:hypothetical protein